MSQTEAKMTNVLAVDHDPQLLSQLEGHLTRAGYGVRTAGSGLEALRILKNYAPKIIITSMKMPEMDGLDLCRAIRASETAGFVYLLVLVDESERQGINEAFDAGADDFLPRSVNEHELLARLKAGGRVLALEEELAQDRMAAHKANAELQILNEKLHQIATTDELTGLGNRREAIERLNELWAVSQRSGQPMSCAMIDIDHFKSFNDRYGHNVGDAVLAATAKTLRSVVRMGETVYRTGGEEFLVICPGSTAEGAMSCGERARSTVESTSIKCEGLDLSLTISVGVAAVTNQVRTIDELLCLADGALYTAKKAGRYRVCEAGQSLITQSAGTAGEVIGKAEALPAGGGKNQKASRVLVVDDDPAIHQLCRGLLEPEGYEVYEAADGAEGLAACKKHRPELILMDLEMPVMDGFECIRQIKADSELRDIPIIIVTGRTDSRDYEGAIELRADEYITKPIKKADFLFRIRSMARLQRSKMELIRSNEVRGDQARALGVLLDLSRSLSAVPNMDEALDKIVTAAAELTSCQRISVMLPDDKGEFLTIAKSIGIDDKVAESVRLPLGGEVAGKVYMSREPVMINDQEMAQPQDQYESRDFVSAPLMSSALRTTDRVVGVLNITDRYDGQSFDPLQLEFIDLICNISASAIDLVQNRLAREDALNAIVGALANLAEHRDQTTGLHQDRVTQFALMLAEELRSHDRYRDQIDSTFLDSLERAVPMHDIGKVAIPDRILLKPGRLTDAERIIMQTHVEVGALTIRSVLERCPGVPFLVMALEVVQGHHEWHNGGGYPRGAKGVDFPLSARIAALADVYDALTTVRPYKDAYTHEKATAIILEGAGTQFDPDVIEAFLARQQDFARLAVELADEEVLAQSQGLIEHGDSPFAEAG